MPAGSSPLAGSSRIRMSGLPEQRLRDAEALAHAERVRRHLVVQPLLKGDHASPAPRSDPAAPRGSIRAEVQQVLPPRQVAVEVRRLDDRADVRHGPREVPRHVEAADPDATAVRPREADEHPDRRRLAGPVRAQESEDLAGADLEGDVRNRLAAAEALGEVLGGEDDLGLSHRDPHRKRVASIALNVSSAFAWHAFRRASGCGRPPSGSGPSRPSFSRPVSCWPCAAPSASRSGSLRPRRPGPRPGPRSTARAASSWSATRSPAAPATRRRGASPSTCSTPSRSGGPPS